MTPPFGAGQSSLAGSMLHVRDATPLDMSSVRQIYAHHVMHGFASFEEDPPTESELLARFDAIRRRDLPYLVAERDGRILGYSYAGPYRQRSAYRFSIEDSVYVADGFGGQRIGRALLRALIDLCEAGPWRRMIAVIGDSCNDASIALHSAFGFRCVGVLKSVGYKCGRWVDSVLMQRELRDGDARALA